jgi:hypothetical protein
MPITATPEGRNIWLLWLGVGSNSPSRADNLPSLLVRLLDQLTAMGEIAAQIRKTFKEDHTSTPYIITMLKEGDAGTSSNDMRW